MGKFLAIFGGLIMMALGVYLVVFVWWREFYELIFGVIPPILFFSGLIAFIAGISGLKDTKRIKKLEAEEEEEEEEASQETEIPAE